MIVHEAATTAVALYQALIGWLIFFAVTGAILALAAVACGAWAVDAAWGRLYGRVRGSEGVEVTPEPDTPSEAPERRTARRAPKWANTQPINEWDEAA